MSNSDVSSIRNILSVQSPCLSGVQYVAVSATDFRLGIQSSIGNFLASLIPKEIALTTVLVMEYALMRMFVLLRGNFIVTN